ncbi:hypothetical protein RND81_10G091200 [Saponaria officinalis]|uniref:Uncharacterized protein n=1 Tax=Saponaria officinalis TaxID=3572 RepID=A0AAW1I294_SAPOF
MELSLLSMSHQKPIILPCNITSTTRKQTLMKWAPPQRSMREGIKCGKNTSSDVVQLRKDFEEIIEKHEMMEKCKEMEKSGEMVELIECLENEAIMGDDVGNQPFDYNRRALLFDKSSKVFQALKHQLGTFDVGSD